MSNVQIPSAGTNIRRRLIPPGWPNPWPGYKDPKIGTKGNKSETDLKPESKCCNSILIASGEAELNRRYKLAEKINEETGVPRFAPPDTNNSCINVNEDILKSLARNPEATSKLEWGLPKCWDCVMEHRQRPVRNNTFIGYETRDHWVVICTASNGKQITFDYWNKNAIPGEGPETYFRVMYPDLVKKNVRIPVWHQVCSGGPIHY